MQKINFYQSLTKPSPYAVSVRGAKIILVGWIVFLTLILMSQYIYITIQNARLSSFINQEKNIATELETLIQHSPKIKHVRKLEDTIVAFLGQINYQTDFIRKITRYNDQVMAFKPAVYLSELSNAAVPEVWLTKMSFQNQGQEINLAGFTLGSSQLTEFIAQLQKEKNFKNRPFTKVTIAHPDNQEPMGFILSTADQKS